MPLDGEDNVIKHIAAGSGAMGKNGSKGKNGSRSSGKVAGKAGERSCGQALSGREEERVELHY